MYFSIMSQQHLMPEEQARNLMANAISYLNMCRNTGICSISGLLTIGKSSQDIRQSRTSISSFGSRICREENESLTCRIPMPWLPGNRETVSNGYSLNFTILAVGSIEFCRQRGGMDLKHNGILTIFFGKKHLGIAFPLRK